MGCCRARLVLVSLLLASSSTAQMFWTQLPPVVSPTQRADCAMVFDELRQRTVLFGGGFGSFGDMWEWDGTIWINRVGLLPTARGSHAMVWDPVRQVIVLFGGRSSGGLLDDTWEFNGSVWIQRFPLSKPTPRWGHAMAYDPVRGRVIMLGGVGATGAKGDMWEWDGETWTFVPTGGVPPRYRHGMAFDAARQRMVLFGGIDDGFIGTLADTREFDGNTWTEIFPATMTPSARSGHAMEYDSSRQRVVLTGGCGECGVGISTNGDTWEWNGQDWLPQPAVTPRSGHAMTYDAARGEMVVFGGALNSGAWMNDTHVYRSTFEGGAMTVGPACGGSLGLPGISAVGQPILFNPDFLVRLTSVRANSATFLGLHVAVGNLPVGGCIVYPQLPFMVVLVSTSDGSGTSDLPIPIPFDPELAGATFHVQGGALDPNGQLFGGASLTPGMKIVIGN